MNCDEFELPCRDALLGATLALMSAYSRPEPDSALPEAARRRLIARKVLSNLFFLRAHPTLPPGLRDVAHALHGHWEQIVAAADDPAAPTTPDPRPAHGQTVH